MNDKLLDSLVEKLSQLPVARLNDYVWRMNEMFYADIANMMHSSGDYMITHYRSAVGELMGVPIEIANVPEPILINKRVEIERANRRGMERHRKVNR